MALLREASFLIPRASHQPGAESKEIVCGTSSGAFGLCSPHTTAVPESRVLSLAISPVFSGFRVELSGAFPPRSVEARRKTLTFRFDLDRVVVLLAHPPHKDTIPPVREQLYTLPI